MKCMLACGEWTVSGALEGDQHPAYHVRRPVVPSAPREERVSQSLSRARQLVQHTSTDHPTILASLYTLPPFFASFQSSPPVSPLQTRARDRRGAQVLHHLLENSFMHFL